MAIITGGNTHQEKDWGALLEPGLRKVFYEEYAEVPEQYSKVFHVKTSTKAQETDFNVGAFGDWDEFGTQIPNGTADGADMPTVKYSKINSGGKTVYTHREFAKGFIVERKYVDDEMYGVIDKMAKDLARAGRYRVEQDACNILNGAFDTVKLNIAGKGAEPLIAPIHRLIDNSAMICSNLVEGSLDVATLKKASTLGKRQVDEAGKLITMNFDTLVVPPELEFEAMEILKTTAEVGTANNTVNTMKGKFKLIVMDRLSDSSRYFLLDSSAHELNFFWRKKVEFGRETDFDSFVQKYKGYMRYSVGASSYRGVIGIKPVGAKLALATVVAKGTAIGTIKATATGTLKMAISNCPLDSISVGDEFNGVDYVSATDIAIKAGQYITVCNMAGGVVVASFSKLVQASDIKLV